MTNFKELTKLTFNEGSTKATLKVAVGTIEGTIYFEFSEEQQAPLFSFSENLEMLKNAGMDLNCDALVSRYEDMLNNREQILLEQKIEKLKAKHAKHWTQNTVLPTIDGVTYKIEDEQSFVERIIESGNTWHEVKSLKVMYKNNIVHVSRERVGGSSWRSNSGTLKFQVRDAITDHNTRNYANLTNAVKKIVALIDAKIVSDAASKQRAVDAENATTQLLADYNALFNNSVIVKTEMAGYGRRHSRPYKVIRFYIVGTDGSEFIISSANTYEDKSFTKFNFGGFKNLTVDQVKAIVEIVK